MSMFFDRERSELIAEYMIEKKATVRLAAKRFGVSKSTVHKDITEKLKTVNPSLYSMVAEILAQNKSVRHLRGGEATRQKYLSRNASAANCLSGV